MAVTKVAHKPDLTKEQALEVFRRVFGGKYEVVPTAGIQRARRDFVVKKNAFAALSVRLEQGEGETKFVYTGYAPNFLARILVYFGGGIVLSYLVWNSLTTEVREFLESAPEFK